MNKINRKGFTLIELLAVIVILAIIVVVTVPIILNSINDAKKSSLNSLAKEVAKWYNDSYAQDLLITDPNKKVLGSAIVPEDGWHCLSEIKDGNVSLADKYGLSDHDLNIVTADNDKISIYDIKGVTNLVPNNAYCSAIKVENNRAIVLLIGKSAGKFGSYYSYSNSATSFELIKIVYVPAPKPYF